MTDHAQLAPSVSAIQRAAETVLLAALAFELGLSLDPGGQVMPDGTRVELDAISKDPPVLVEAWCHHGPPKSAQKHKVTTDAEARLGGGGPLRRRRAEDPGVG